MLEKIKEILTEQLGIDPQEITMEASFSDDLGIDSLDLFEMVLGLEAEYGIEVPADELESMKTVGDVVDFMQRNNIQ